MSILSVIGSVAGLAQGLQQNQAARGQQRQALDLYRQNAVLMRKEQERRVEVARGMIASGYGDPTAQIAASRQATAVNQGLQSRNLANLYRLQGYEAGDSPQGNAQQGLSEQYLARQSAAEEGIRANAYAQTMNLQPFYSPSGEMQANYAYGNGLQQDAYNQQIDVGGMVAGLANADYGFLKPRKRAVASDPNGFSEFSVTSSPLSYYGAQSGPGVDGSYGVGLPALGGYGVQTGPSADGAYRTGLPVKLWGFQ